MENAKAYPKFHFCPKSGWMNDPNGLMYLNGQYHMFFQYQPFSTEFGNMHWGHASTKDFIHWNHLPIALYPDTDGCIYSGSAAEIQTENGQNQIMAIYAHHGYDPEGTESIHIAFSLDKINFTPYEGNPVIFMPQYKYFRDPYLFQCPNETFWRLAVSTGNMILFLVSEDLIHWNETGRFIRKEDDIVGLWECPQLCRVKYEDTFKWVLIISHGMEAENGGSRTRYFIGSFNGYTFIDEAPGSTSKWVDFGPDSYAGAFFRNTEDHPVFIAWMSNWAYAKNIPADGYRGVMSLPVSVSLTKENEFLLSFQPVSNLLKVFSEPQPLPDQQVAALPDAVCLEISAKNGSVAILKDIQGRELLCFGIDSDGYIFLNRSGESARTIPHFEGSFTSSIKNCSDHMCVFIDRNTFELFANGGHSKCSALFFSDSPLILWFQDMKIQKRDYTAISED